MWVEKMIMIWCLVLILAAKKLNYNFDVYSSKLPE